MNFKKAVQQQLPCEYNKGDCGVKALSILCDVPYPVAHKTLKLLGRKDGGSTSLGKFWLGVIDLGFKGESIKDLPKGLTVGNIERTDLISKGHYFIHTAKHGLSAINGRIEDHSRGSRRRIIDMWKIVPATSRKDRKQRIKQIMEA